MNQSLLQTLTPAGLAPDLETLKAWLTTTDNRLHESLVTAAFALKKQHAGPGIFLRGLMEISNHCQKNCLYCGIRGKNATVARYELSDEEILHLGQKAAQLGYASIVLQAGERQDNKFVLRITKLLKSLKSIFCLAY